MNGSDVIVKVSGLVKDFRPGFGLRRKRVLHGIDLQVRRGEVFGFIGPNGAGKTTTLKILMGLIRATEGSAEILGHDVRETAFRRHVGFLPEGPYFYDFLTGREILRFYGKLAGGHAASPESHIDELLEWVGLSQAADLRLRAYSKGMLQRIGIAQALVHDPEVVFLDEPMSGLDPIGRKEIRDLILRLHGEGKTIFMNTHILSDVEVICDRVAIIAEGRVVHEGGAHVLLERERQPFDIAVSGLDPELAESLVTELDAELRGRGERVEVRVREKDVDLTLERILARGGRVRGVAPVNAALEELFLKAVEGGPHEEEGA
ncbi:MAG: ABC transporter [Deltaproteobacteria bacterium]|nr:ABC transporter [Deltaproteobacteria bacterium]